MNTIAGFSTMFFRITRFCFFFILCIFLKNAAYCQSRSSDTTIIVTDTTNLDALYKRARELSYDNHYSQARRICQKILEQKPNYYDVRTFLGRTYAWEKQYDNARTELSRVLIEKENDYEALTALFDVEFWTESYSVANDYLKVALGYYPTSVELLLRKAKLQIKLEEKGEAALTLRRILDLNPGQKEAISIMNSLEGRKLSNNFVTSFLVDLYDKNKVQQLVTSELGRNFSFGSLIIRVNMADRFQKKGFQYEVETYTHITPSAYINLLAGYSNVSIFPKEKYTLEVYQKLISGFELSLGIRSLNYTKSTMIYTAALSNYYKDYYFNVKTYITPKTDSVIRSVSLNKTSFTIIALFRTYFGDSDTYLELKGGKGRSPDETKTLEQASFLPTYQGGFAFQKRAFGRWLLKIDMTYAKENIDSEKNRFSRRYSTNLTLKTVF